PRPPRHVRALDRAGGGFRARAHGRAVRPRRRAGRAPAREGDDRSRGGARGEGLSRLDREPDARGIGWCLGNESGRKGRPFPPSARRRDRAAARAITTVAAGVDWPLIATALV